MTGHKIPVQNLYYLLCYAWNQLDQGNLVDISAPQSTELVDLFASVLLKGTDHLARRGLARGYEPHDENLRGMKGRIDVLPTARRFLLKHGQVACQFDELTVNTLANQILKATFRSLALAPELSKDHRSAVLRAARDLKGIDDIVVSAHSFRRIQLGANTRFYRFILNVCELIHSSRLPEQSSGRLRFRDFIRDEEKMAYLFQNFVYNFLKLERRDLTVRRENIAWSASSVTDPHLSLLPQMQTDISIDTGMRRIIIDTKYYQKTLNEHYGNSKIHSANLYQLVSYLANVKATGVTHVEGILLYPFAGEHLHQTYVILGMPIRTATIDLSRPWEEVRTQLIELPN